MSSAQRTWASILNAEVDHCLQNAHRAIRILVIHTPSFSREIIALFTGIWLGVLQGKMQNMPGRCSVQCLEICSGSWVLGLALKFTVSPLNHLPFPCISFPSSRLETVVFLPMNPEKQLIGEGLYSQCVANKYCNMNNSVPLHIIIYSS